MKRQLYVTSKKLEQGRRLIGILSEENGKYSFEYKLGGYVPEWFLVLKEFPDVSIKYSGAEVDRFIGRIVPSEDNAYIQGFLDAANLSEYDKWELLKYCGQHNTKQDAYLYETLPERVITYEPVEQA